MINGLQVGRGIAALLVVLHHASQGAPAFYGGEAFHGFWRFGDIGVDFFFVLSGFIIYTVHRNDTQQFESAKIYSIKRLIRIYPPFLPISIVLLGVYLSYPHLNTVDREIGVLASLLLVPSEHQVPALSVSWTLMHEMLFYILFLMFYVSANALKFMFVAWGLAICLTDIVSFPGLIGSFVMNPHNLQFLFGILAAVLYYRRRVQGYHLIVGIGLLCLFVFNYHFENLDLIKSALQEKVYLGITFMMIVTGLCAVDNYIRYPTILLSLGAASYSIYLIHYPVLSVFNRLAAQVTSYVGLPVEVLFILLSVLAVLAGFLYYSVWEKPTLKWLQRRIINYHNQR